MKQKLTNQFMKQDDTFWDVEEFEGYSEFTSIGYHGCQCTGFAVRIQEKLGADRVQVMGFTMEDNPQAGIGSICNGHDFALVDGRYIVDPWLVEVETGSITTPKGTKLELDGQGVFDLETEAELVTTIYGNKKYWIEMKPVPKVKLLAINVIAKLEAIFSTEKWWCGNCSATGERGEELLVDSYGNAHCPDCCSEVINEGTNKVGG